MDRRPLVVFGMLGTKLDNIKHNRWNRWRPTVGLCQQPDLLVDRLELLYEVSHTPQGLTERICTDIARVSPETEVVLHPLRIRDAWDFGDVYGMLHTFASSREFRTEDEDYLVHITTGTHVMQICFFLLTESRHFPARLIQTAPRGRASTGVEGTYSVIDLDLSRYDQIAMRFRAEHRDGVSFLKSGIDTRNRAFNEQIDLVEQVAILSEAPVLLMGPTGAGKSRLARRIYELKARRHQLEGPFVEVNCATLRGDAAMSTLFGHTRGAFTGAVKARPGLLRTADTGLLFLDEIGELGTDEQAMLLRALEEKRFLPVGADIEVESKFQLIAGTNRDLGDDVRNGRFREDLLARINLWTFTLPGLRQRLEDLEPNLDYEIEEFARASGHRVTFNKEARAAYLHFARAPQALWSANFRDLNASVTRMATLAPGGRITKDVVAAELERLAATWGHASKAGVDLLDGLLTAAELEAIDEFDRLQLAAVVRVCRASQSLSDAGRQLFQASRKKKKKPNDADRLRKFLLRFGLRWDDVQR